MDADGTGRTDGLLRVLIEGPITLFDHTGEFLPPIKNRGAGRGKMRGTGGRERWGAGGAGASWMWSDIFRTSIKRAVRGLG